MNGEDVQTVRPKLTQDEAFLAQLQGGLVVPVLPFSHPDEIQWFKRHRGDFLLNGKLKDKEMAIAMNQLCQTKSKDGERPTFFAKLPWHISAFEKKYTRGQINETISHAMLEELTRDLDLVLSAPFMSNNHTASTVRTVPRRSRTYVAESQPNAARRPPIVVMSNGTPALPAIVPAAPAGQRQPAAPQRTHVPVSRNVPRATTGLRKRRDRSGMTCGRCNKKKCPGIGRLYPTRQKAMLADFPNMPKNFYPNDDRKFMPHHKQLIQNMKGGHHLCPQHTEGCDALCRFCNHALNPHKRSRYSRRTSGE